MKLILLFAVAVYAEKILPLPNDPKNVILSEITSSSVVVQWEPPTDDSGVTSYDITIYPAPEKGVATVNKPKYRLLDPPLDWTRFKYLTPETSYTVTVQSKSGKIASTGFVQTFKTDKALKCYQCSSGTQYSCGDPDDSWRPFQDSTMLKDCHPELSKGCIKEKIGDGPDAVVYRGCSYLDTDECLLKYSQGKNHYNCNCKGEGCNGAGEHTLHVGFILLLAVLHALA